MNTPNILVFSDRKYSLYPAMNCVVELEDVIIEMTNGQLILDAIDITDEAIIFIVGISIYQIDRIIRRIPKQKKNIRIFSYLFDAFLIPNENKSFVRSLISKHRKQIKRIEHLFVPFLQAKDDFNRIYEIPVSYIPLGVDVKNYGGCDEDKFIDINAYGRQPKELTNFLSSQYNVKGSKKYFSHTDHNVISEISDIYSHRRLFWHSLRKSKISLVYDGPYLSKDRYFPFSFVPQRMFEAAAAGCVIMGKKPSCRDMDELFFWTDSFIDLPDDIERAFDFIEKSYVELDFKKIGQENYINTLENHDWRIRLNKIFNIIGVPLT